MVNKISPMVECNICYEEVCEKKIFKCGNEACTFNMCKKCGVEHVRIKQINKCPQCQQTIKHNNFIKRSFATAITGEVVDRYENHSKLICKFPKITVVDKYPNQETITIIYNRFLCFTTNENSCVKDRKTAVYISSYICCTIFGTGLIFIPKIMGYYMCTCNWGENIVEAWLSSNGATPMCQPYAGLAVCTAFCGWCKTIDTCFRPYNISTSVERVQPIIGETCCCFVWDDIVCCSACLDLSCISCYNAWQYSLQILRQCCICICCPIIALSDYSVLGRIKPVDEYIEEICPRNYDEVTSNVMERDI